MAYVMLDPNENSLEIDCCGVVSEWQFNTQNTSNGDVIYLQIWRPSTGTTYELAGQNQFTLSKLLYMNL